MTLITRRMIIAGGAAGAGFSMIGCAKITGVDALTASPSFQHVLGAAEGWSLNSQRFLLSGGAMAREFSLADLSPNFKSNGTRDPGGEEYDTHVEEEFANWRLKVTGMVARPLSLSLGEIRALPSRTQITRHDCVEGWSAIGGWTGVQLGLLLKAAAPLAGARYAVMLCADNLDGEPAKGGMQVPGQYYESIDLTDAQHPQTLIAYALNGKPLDVGHGAPLRLRVERQLGYKQAKYIHTIQLVSSLQGIGDGKGGYWEDRGYEWYAGI